MANVSASNSTNISSKFPDNNKINASLEINSKIITIIINGITCPFTFLLNVLVIIAVKRRPRLQTNANILLACLATTDALTGLIAQPSFILHFLSQLLGVKKTVPFFRVFHNFFMRALSVCSCLHLMAVTCERLLAIKFTMNYRVMVTKKNMTVAVTACWIFSFSCEIFRQFKSTVNVANVLIAFTLILCILFVTSVYFVLYLETRRHQKMIRTQQLPQEEVERFSKESKALKTTVYVVCSVVICFLPMSFVFASFVKKLQIIYSPPLVRTLALLNSLLNPLIYCWRQKEMRRFVFRIRTAAAVGPAD